MKIFVSVYRIKVKCDDPNPEQIDLLINRINDFGVAIKEDSKSIMFVTDDEMMTKTHLYNIALMELSPYDVDIDTIGFLGPYKK